MENKSNYAAAITFTLSAGLKEEFDNAIKEAHYNSRSAALAEAMRDFLDKLKRRSRR